MKTPDAFTSIRSLSRLRRMKRLPDRRSLATRVADLIRDEVLGGEWKEALPGQRALADRFRVSRPTIAAAVAQLRRERLLRVEPGRPSRVMRSAASRRSRPAASRTIRVLSTLPFDNLSYRSLYCFCELERRLAEEGYRIEIHSEPVLRKAHPFAMLERLARMPPAACWILHGARPEIQAWFARRSLPVVLTSAAEEGLNLPFVDFAYEAMARHAAGLLLRQGHRRVGLLLNRHARVGERRLERTLREEIEVCARADGRLFTFEQDDAPDSIGRAMARAREGASAVSVMVATGTGAAMSALGHLAQEGVRVPRDLSFLCCQDDPLIQCHVPDVTRYRGSLRGFARAMQRLTLDVAAGSAVHRNILLMPEFHRGATLAPSR